jgi:hypothetical protein
MAVDHETLQALATCQPTSTTLYCPECGRPWAALAAEEPCRAPSSWHVVFLAVVGISVALTFGVRAARANQRYVAIQGELAGLTGCVGGLLGNLTCSSVENADSRVATDDGTMAQGQRDRALVVTALGLFAVGLSSIARHRRVQDRSRSTFSALLGLGEYLVALTCLQVLALTVYPIAVQLSRGLPFTWDRLDVAVDGVLVLVSLLTGR